MTPTPLRTAAILGVLGVLLVGCSAGTDRSAELAAASASTSAASAAPSASASTTLTPQEQQAVDEAAAVVLARAQLFYEIQADLSRPINEINDVVAHPQLDLDLLSLQEAVASVAEGTKVVTSTGPVTIASASPVSVDLLADPALVVVEVCLDRTATDSSYKGAALEPGRELARYRVVKTEYLPAPGWAVSKVLPPAGFDQPQPC